jgi:hypothetical protein
MRQFRRAPTRSKAAPEHCVGAAPRTPKYSYYRAQHTFEESPMTLVRTNQPAPDLVLGGGTGAVNISSLWRDGPLVLYFHRHFG